MNFYFSKTLEMPFDQAIRHVTDAPAAKGFGVLTTIDVSATIKKKLGEIGTMPPCNVIVQEAGRVEVSAVDPCCINDGGGQSKSRVRRQRG